jgi:hypothetical protein
LNINGSGSAQGTIYNAGSNNHIEVKNWMIAYPMTGAGAYTVGGATNPIVGSASTGSNGNVISITNGTFTVSSSSVNKLQSLGSNNKYHFNFTDFLAGSVSRTAGAYNYEVVSMNHNKTIGAWHYEDRYGYLDSSNTYRTGGSNFSLKATMNESQLGQNRRGLQLSPKNREIIWITLNAGTNVVRLYGAYKNYVGSNPTLRDVGFSFDWFDTNNSANVVSTPNDGALASDGSTWNNDPGVTPFVITASIASAQQQTVPFNIFLSPQYDTSGYLYIDPQPTVGVS